MVNAVVDAAASVAWHHAVLPCILPWCWCHRPLVDCCLSWLQLTIFVLIVHLIIHFSWQDWWNHHPRLIDWLHASKWCGKPVLLLMLCCRRNTCSPPDLLWPLCSSDANEFISSKRSGVGKEMNRQLQWYGRSSLWCQWEKFTVLLSCDNRQLIFADH